MSNKKVLISTMHRGNNYGSALQVYALSESIRKLGHNPVVLDYIPDRVNDRLNLLILIKKLLGFNSIALKYQAFRGLMILITSYKCYNSFFKRHLCLTKRYPGVQSVFNNPPKADIYLTGSDQVWNSKHNQGIDPIFFLGFAPDDKPKFSYAASFGREELDEWEIDETRRLLNRYKSISVRELSALDVLSSIGIKDSKCVLDPTFLLDRNEWQKRAVPHTGGEKYVLIYSVEPDKQSVIRAARAIADKINAKVYMVEWGRKPYDGVDKMISLVDPLMLIDYFDKAAFVVASSFHGTALSVNLNKQFITISPERFNTRVKSILELLDLEDRLVSSDTKWAELNVAEIDYNNVNIRLNKLREDSLDYLKSILDD